MDNAAKRGRRFRRGRSTASLAQHAVAGIVPGDHVCTSFGSDDEHQAIVGRCARQALRRGERFVYLVHTSEERTIRRYLEQEGLDVEAGVALGQIEIRSFDDERARLHPEAIIAAMQADRRAAMRDGYSALCVTCEMSWAVAGAGEVDAVVRYEHEVDRVFAGADIAGICQYDRRRFDREMLERLVRSHEFQICTDRDFTTTARRRLTISEGEDRVIALSGALDIDSSAYVAARFAEVDDSDDVVVLTAGLDFADISGCRALVHAAEDLGSRRHMLLPDPARPLLRVLKLCGWSSHERLVLS